MLQGIPPHQLVLLVFHKSEYNRSFQMIEQHELSYRGEMYDVVQQQQQMDSVYFWCWPDAKETALNLALQVQMQQAWGQFPPRKHTESLVHSWLALRYLTPGSLKWKSAPSTSMVHYPILSISLYPAYFLGRLSPPPEYTCAFMPCFGCASALV
jgi:hypothetical protein